MKKSCVRFDQFMQPLERRVCRSAVPGSILTIASKGDVGQYSSLQINPTNNQPAIAYYDATRHDLKYTAYNGKAWVGTTVDAPGLVGVEASLRFDASGRPWIAYYDQTHHSLKLAYEDQPTWTVRTVDSGGSQGRYLSLALTRAGLPVIAYYGNTTGRAGGLKLATMTAAGWSIRSVDVSADATNYGAAGVYCSLALDGHDRPRIAYSGSDGSLLYASFDGHNWHNESAPTGPVFNFISGITLVLDHSGSPHIAYDTDSSTDFGGTAYVVKTGSQWKSTNVDSGQYPGRGDDDSYSLGLVLDSSDRPTIAYRVRFGFVTGSTDNQLAVASTGSSAFVDRIADSSGRVGGYTSMAADAKGRLFISYYDNVSRDLKLFVRTNG